MSSTTAQIPSPHYPDTIHPLPVSPPLPQIPSPPLPVSSPVPMLSPSPPASPIRLLGYRAVMIRLRVEAASTSHSLPLPPPIILSYTKLDAPSLGTPPLHLLSTDRREEKPKVTLPPRKRLGIALGPRYEIEESSSTAAARPVGDVGYGITDSWDKIVEAIQGTPVVTDVAEFSQRMTEFETRVRRDTDEAMIDQGVTAILAARDANTNGIDNHNSGTGVENWTQWIENGNCVPHKKTCSVGKPNQVLHLYSSGKCSNVVELPR
ncbi:hypothetical protein Tco_0479364 [Tanacetum coccineum]